MNLVVDYGNTFAKVGIFDHQNLMEKHTFSGSKDLQNFLLDNRADNMIVSSVNVAAEEILSWAKHVTQKFILHHTLPLPIKNDYKTPATLGVDRLAGVCGANQLFPFQNCLVIDAGTCITFDFIDAHAHYKGGAISPGLMMRFKAVHTFTAKLPLVTPDENIGLIGNTTEQCIQSGVVNGLIAEIDGLIHRYNEEYENMRVILCGGDALFFENKLKASIFASPDLVLVGLNSILIYNVNQ